MLQRVLPLTMGLMLGAGAPNHAQQVPTRQAWELQNLRATWCIYFLMDSTTADKELPSEFRPRRAADFPDLSLAIRSLVLNEPTYQGWVPAQFCAAHFDQATVGDQTVGAVAPPLEETQFLGMWLIGASPVSGEGPATEPSFYIVTLRTPNWRIIRLAETSLIRIEHAEPLIGKVPESTEDRYQVKMGRTLITWDGHLAGDSAWSAPPQNEKWWSLNSRGARLLADVQIRPDSAQNVAGTLQIVGRDDLAKSLRASPIRMVGPVTWGGSGSIVFSR